MKTVYFDMDGVLVDLALGLSSAEGYDDLFYGLCTHKKKMEICLFKMQ